MYSPVFLSCPTTSGSPPVLSISWSDHSFSVSASSFACTSAHSRPLWRFMFFSKRAFNDLSSSSRCSGGNSFFVLRPVPIAGPHAADPIHLNTHDQPFLSGPAIRIFVRPEKTFGQLVNVRVSALVSDLSSAMEHR